MPYKFFIRSPEWLNWPFAMSWCPLSYDPRGRVLVLGRRHISHIVKVLNLIESYSQTNYVNCNDDNEGSTKIVSFMTPGAWGLVSWWGHNSHILVVKCTISLKIFLCSQRDCSDKHKKTELMMCLLIPIVLTGCRYIEAFLCLCWFLLAHLSWKLNRLLSVVRL